MQAQTIEEVIRFLDQIIEESRAEPSRAGYFAALYNLVTKLIKEKVDLGKDGPFQDPARMERLDVLFANRYLEAYTNWRAGKPNTQSAAVAFEYVPKWPPIVLQHLMGGMNVHISLDLGIAAAEVVREFNQPIEALDHDFKQINVLLASLVDQVEKQMGMIWPALRTILRWVPGDLDNQIINFSMEIAREAAWKFALDLSAQQTPEDWDKTIVARDKKVAKFGRNVLSPPWWIKAPLLLVKMTEWGSISQQIAVLNGEKGWTPQVELPKAQPPAASAASTASTE